LDKGLVRLEKKSVIKKLVKEKKAKLKEKGEELKLIEKQLEDASGAISTNPETENDKKAYGRIKAEIEKSIGDCQKVIETLKSFSAENREIVAGALVEISIDKKRGFYLVVPGASVCPIPIKIKGRVLNFVSVKSPVGQAILGLRAGDKTRANGGVIEIISVQ